MSASDHSSERDDEQTDGLEEFAEAFGKSLGPLIKHEETFKEIDRDPFETYYNQILRTEDLKPDTLKHYRSVYSEWREFVQERGRHHACPSDKHVTQFIEWQQEEKNNASSTIKGKLRKLNRAYEFLQSHPGLPYPHDYNPFEIGKKKANLSNSEGKEFPQIPLGELREMIASVMNVRSRSIIGLQLKIGARAGEVSNIKISDLSIQHSELQRMYPEMGSAERLRNRENALYIPSGTKRDGNKSKRPRVLPLDDELRQLLTRYLLMRPDCDEPWVFLSIKSHSGLNASLVNDIWKQEFHPEYEGTENVKAVTSHFGRHKFTTWWRVKKDVNRELVKYMRGDKQDGNSGNREAIDEYIHTYYEDIKDLYLENIYKLGL